MAEIQRQETYDNKMTIALLGNFDESVACHVLHTLVSLCNMRLRNCAQQIALQHYQSTLRHVEEKPTTHHA